MSERATVLRRSEKRGASERPAFSRHEEEHRGPRRKYFRWGLAQAYMQTALRCSESCCGVRLAATMVRGTGLAPLDSRWRRHARHRITKRPCSVALSALSRRGGATILMDCCLFRPFKSRLERIRHKNKTSAQPMLYRGLVVRGTGLEPT